MPSPGGGNGNGGGSGGSDRRTPPSRAGGARSTRRSGAGASGGTRDSAKGTAKGTAKSSGGDERRFSPRQLLPGGKRDGDGAEQDPTAQPGGSTPKPSAISRNWTGGYTSVDYFMLLPGFVVAYFGGQLVRQCAVEAGGAAAIALWAMIGFWVVVGSARWPTFRVLRWAWVLAGVLGAVWTPG